MRAMTLQIILSLILLSCNNINKDKVVNKTDLLGNDYRLFQNTPAWDLAKAVWDDDEKKINDILMRDKKLVDFKDPKYGRTLLILTIANQQFKSFQILLKKGADLSIHDTYDGTSALIEACSNSQFDIKFVEQLLKYGANVNDVEKGKRRKGNSTRNTPLMFASQNGLVNIVELLLKSGVNVNYKNEFKQTALNKATLVSRYNIVLILLENGANYSDPIFYRDEEKREMYLVDVLREDLLNLNTKEYKDKMAVVSFLRSKGVEYKNTPIPDFIKEKVKENYPYNWQDYLDKY